MFCKFSFGQIVGVIRKLVEIKKVRKKGYIKKVHQNKQNIYYQKPKRFSKFTSDPNISFYKQIYNYTSYYSQLLWCGFA